MERLKLSKLSDLQKTYLTQLSYIDINRLGLIKIQTYGLRVCELERYLLNPSLPFCGTAIMNKETFNMVAKLSIGECEMWTDLDLLNHLIDIGLGNIIITDIECDSKTGFQATVFKDGDENVGVSFRGSDLDFSNGGVADWIEADFLEYFTNDSTQRQQAISLFNNSKHSDGKNYLYGHSLGGNLASHVLAECYEDVAEVFTVNGYPINQALLNTKEKVDVFNSDKFNCNLIAGDIVSHLKSGELYQENVRFVKNNGAMKPSIMSAHLVQAAEFDECGDFVTVSKAEMLHTMGKFRVECTNLAQIIRTKMNGTELSNWLDKTQNVEIINPYKNELLRKLDELTCVLHDMKLKQNN